jgi:copper type II ascorbate-dependent monooxygenase-like protein
MKKICFLTTLLGLFFCFAIVDSASSSASSEKNSTLTFSKDIAPILYKNCISCHRQGEIAPMSLVSYKEARPWAKAIREKIITREMPPWHPDPAVGHWSNDRRMSQKEIDSVVAWIDAGAKEGNPKDLPAMPKFSSGWQIGEPDVIFKMPEEFTVPAEGAIPYQYFRVPTNFKEDRYIHAMEARAGNLSVVHHVVIYVREPGYKQPKKLDLGDGLLGALSPGQTPFIAEPGSAKLIKAGSELIFQLHYTPNGKEAKDRSYIGLIFAKEPVERVITTTAAFDTRFVIPPGAQNYEIKASYEFEQDAQIISFMPHMHLRGKDIVYKAVYPDGRSETLLNIPRYDFGWQVYYYPVRPLMMPKGTRIEAVAHYDNSTRNPLNPDPAKAVRFGEQTWDEMMNAFIDYTTAAPKSGDRSR